MRPSERSGFVKSKEGVLLFNSEPGLMCFDLLHDEIGGVARVAGDGCAVGLIVTRGSMKNKQIK